MSKNPGNGSTRCGGGRGREEEGASPQTQILLFSPCSSQSPFLPTPSPIITIVAINKVGASCKFRSFQEPGKPILPNKCSCYMGLFVGQAQKPLLTVAGARLRSRPVSSRDPHSSAKLLSYQQFERPAFRNVFPRQAPKRLDLR